MRIYRELIIDIETGHVLYEDSFKYDGPVMLAKSKNKKEPLRDVARRYAEEDRAIAGEERGARDVALGETGPALSRYYGGTGDVRETPFYKSLLTSGIEDTTRAYDQGQSAQRLKARAAGFGYEQPVSIGSETALEQERASELARVPREATLQATGPQFQALGMRTQQAGMYQPLGYTASATAGLGQAHQIAEARRRRRTGLFKTLAGVGLMAASPFTGGTTGPIGAAMMKG